MRSIAELLVRGNDGLLEVGRKGRVDDGLAKCPSAARQFREIGSGQPCRQALKRFREAGFAYEVPEGITRNGKPVGNANPGGRQLAVQLAQRRILAANCSYVPEPDVLEPPDEHWLVGHEGSVMHSLGQAMRAVLLQFESREAKFFPLAQGNISIHT
jgi:hypothetical protein